LGLLICLAGDFIYGSHPVDDRSPLETQENVLPFFRACASLAPTFMSLGNHEQMLDAVDLERIRSTGVVVLDNFHTYPALASSRISPLGAGRC